MLDPIKLCKTLDVIKKLHRMSLKEEQICCLSGKLDFSTLLEKYSLLGCLAGSGNAFFSIIV